MSVPFQNALQQTQIPNYHISSFPASYNEPMTPSLQRYDSQNVMMPPAEALITSIPTNRQTPNHGFSDLPSFCFTDRYRWSPDAKEIRDMSNGSRLLFGEDFYDNNADGATTNTFRLPWTPKKDLPFVTAATPQYMRGMMPPLQPAQNWNSYGATNRHAHQNTPRSSHLYISKNQDDTLPPQLRSLYNACTVGPPNPAVQASTTGRKPTRCDALFRAVLTSKTLMRSTAGFLCERDALSLALSCPYIYSVLDAQWWMGKYPIDAAESGTLSAWAYKWPNCNGYCDFCHRWQRLVVHEPSKAILCLDCIQFPTFRLLRFAIARQRYMLEDTTAFAALSVLPSVLTDSSCYFWTCHLEWTQAQCQNGQYDEADMSVLLMPSQVIPKTEDSLDPNPQEPIPVVENIGPLARSSPLRGRSTRFSTRPKSYGEQHGTRATRVSSTGKHFDRRARSHTEDGPVQKKVRWATDPTSNFPTMNMKEESVNVHRLLAPIAESSNQITQQSLGQEATSNTSVLGQVSYSSTPLETAHVSHPDDLNGITEGALPASVLTDEDGEHEVDAGV